MRDTRLDGEVVAEIVRRRARQAGLEDRELYNGHSLRAGFATAIVSAPGGGPQQEALERVPLNNPPLPGMTQRYQASFPLPEGLTPSSWQLALVAEGVCWFSCTMIESAAC